MAIVAKMKRRMKQMIDVAEKYAVADIFDTINLLQQMSNKINLDPIEGPDARARRLSRRSRSMTQLETDSTDSRRSSRQLSPLPASPRPDLAYGARKMNTFKSFSDHLVVLTKTYTNRR
jgi:hypothetical protein